MSKHPCDKPKARKVWAIPTIRIIDIQSADFPVVKTAMDKTLASVGEGGCTPEALESLRRGKRLPSPRIMLE